MTKEEIAETLDEYADFLRLDGQDGRAYAYEKAARSVRLASYLPPNPARLNNVGDSTREAIIDLENGTGIEELSDLQEKYDWYDEFKDVKHIGPSRAKQIKEELNITDIDMLALAAKNGDLTLLSGVGPATEEKIKRSIETNR